MRRPGRSIVAGFGLAVLSLALPSTAWAQAAGSSARFTFDATKFGAQRLPAESPRDFPVPKTDRGAVSSDVPGFACDGLYSIQFLRHRTVIPDAVEYRLDDRRVCDDRATEAGQSWARGRYHFDARMLTRVESAFGSGTVGAAW